MDFANYWFSAQAGNPPDPVEQIGESLRFRQLTTTTGSTLSRTGFATGGDVWTFSCWMKGWSGSAQTQCPIFSWHVNAADAVDELAILSNFPSDTENIIYFYFEGSNNGNFESNQQFNDPAAWYNVVWQASSLTDVRLFINGNQVTDWATSDAVTSQNYINKNATCSIGSRAPANTSPSGISYYGDGYLADVYFIDGQALLPTAFGRFNDDGVWVPREVDFTPAEMRYSDFLTAPNGFVTNRQPANAFNGALPTNDQQAVGFIASTNSGNMTFAPVPGIDFDTTVEVWCGEDAGNNISFNGGANQAVDSYEWVTIATGGGTINTIELSPRGINSATHLAGIRINGNEILLNPFMYSANLFTGANGSTAFDWDTTATNFPAGSPATFGFDNQNNNVGSNANNSLIFRPNPALTGITEIAVETDATTTWQLGLNGADVNSQDAFGTGGYKRVQLPAGFDGTVTSFGIRNTNAQDISAFSRIRINGTTVLVDGINNSYGPNGFHLTFADPDNLGLDSSGNGNDFTAQGFNTDPVGIWSSDLSAGSSANDMSGGCGTATAGDMFIAATGGVPSAVNPESCWLVFQPTPELTDITQLEIFLPGLNGQQVAINGTVQYGPVNGASGWTNIPLPTDFDGTLNSVSIFASGAGNRALGVRINGDIVLVDNTGADYDSMEDSPTQNYATLNPLVNDLEQEPATLSNANLEMTWAAQNSSASAYPTIPIRLDDPNTYYVESNIIAADNTTYPAMYFNRSSRPGANAAGNIYFYQENSGNIVFGDGSQATGVSWTTGDVVGITINPSADTVTIQVNGAASNTVDLGSQPNDEYVVFNLNSATTRIATYNTGQQPFLYQPDGTVPLQTQNLPAAPITNGRDHFQAITGPGNGADGTPVDGQLSGNFLEFFTVSSVDEASGPPSNAFSADGIVSTFYTEVGGNWTFAPDPPIPVGSKVEIYQQNSRGATTWNGETLQPNETTITFNSTGEISAANPITSTSAGTPEVCYCSAIWVDDQLLVENSILVQAQQTFQQGLWWIKDMDNENNWQLACSEYDVAPTDNVVLSNTTGYQPYTAPAGSSVAYCWDLTDPATSGCQFISDTGTGTARTVNHNLGRVPGMIWAFNVGAASANQIYVYHQSLGPGQALSLPETALYDRDIFWGNDPAQFTTTTFGVGSDGSTNPAGPVYYWLWAEIPGYSAFGIYDANDDPNGPFCYLGFKPALVLLKTTGTTPDNSPGNWLIADSTNSPNNPVTQWLCPNLETEEWDGQQSIIDMLSNGFKLRSSNWAVNGESNQYVYAAFAENPFGGSNVSPANAR